MIFKILFITLQTVIEVKYKRIKDMKVTLLKRSGKREVINRIELEQGAGLIKTVLMEKSVWDLRSRYHLMQTRRLEDGRIETNWKGGITLPRICFAADFENRKGEQRMLGYNGLVTVEVNGLQSYEKAVEVRELAKKMPETMMAFLGASGKSVKIICRGELFREADQTTPPDGTEDCSIKTQSPNLGGETTPLLFSSNSLFVDDNMRVLGTFHRETPHYTKQNVMIYPTEQGCSMVFNRSALELYDANPPKNAWHDRWMCLICNFLGKSVYCQSPLFYYRIHGGNMIGKKQNFWDRIMDDIKFFFTSDAKNSQMVDEFYQSYKYRLSDEDRDVLNVFLNYKDYFKNKWKIVMSPEYQRASNWQERMRKAVLLFFNKI